MMTTPKLEDLLAPSRKTPGWNFRSQPVTRHRIGRCTLIVVPANYWREAKRHRRAVQLACNGLAESNGGAA